MFTERHFVRLPALVFCLWCGVLSLGIFCCGTTPESITSQSSGQERGAFFGVGPSWRAEGQADQEKIVFEGLKLHLSIGGSPSIDEAFDHAKRYSVSEGYLHYLNLDALTEGEAEEWLESVLQRVRLSRSGRALAMSTEMYRTGIAFVKDKDDLDIILGEANPLVMRSIEREVRVELGHALAWSRYVDREDNITSEELGQLEAEVDQVYEDVKDQLVATRIISRLIERHWSGEREDEIQPIWRDFLEEYYPSEAQSLLNPEVLSTEHPLLSLEKMFALYDRRAAMFNGLYAQAWEVKPVRMFVVPVDFAGFVESMALIVIHTEHAQEAEHLDEMLLGALLDAADAVKARDLWGLCGTAEYASVPDMVHDPLECVGELVERDAGHFADLTPSLLSWARVSPHAQGQLEQHAFPEFATQESKDRLFNYAQDVTLPWRYKYGTAPHEPEDIEQYVRWAQGDFLDDLLRILQFARRTRFVASVFSEASNEGAAMPWRLALAAETLKDLVDVDSDYFGGSIFSSRELRMLDDEDRRRQQDFWREATLPLKPFDAPSLGAPFFDTGDIDITAFAMASYMNIDLSDPRELDRLLNTLLNKPPEEWPFGAAGSKADRASGSLRCD